MDTYASLDCKSDGSTDSQNTCPTCDAPIAGIITRGPGVHEAVECGHRLSAAYIGQLRKVATDGGTETAANETDRSRASHIKQSVSLAETLLTDEHGARTHPQRRDHTLSGIWHHLRQSVSGVLEGRR